MYLATTDISKDFIIMRLFSNRINKAQRCFLKAIIVVLLLSASKGFSETSFSGTSPSSLFHQSLQQYVSQPANTTHRIILEKYLNDYTIEGIDYLLNTYSPLQVAESLHYHSAGSLNQLQKEGEEDFLLVVLETTLSSLEYLQALDRMVSLDPQKLSDTVIQSRSRFTGALFVFQEIRLDIFQGMLQVFSENLPKEIVVNSFYQDPYLFSSAFKVLAQHDPNTTTLQEFLTFFDDRQLLIDLFKNDLAGLVVAYSTIQEIRAGNEVLWAKEIFDITDEHLNRLIIEKPANMAYILYGGHQIGVANFKKIIFDIGREQFQKALSDHTVWLADFIQGMGRASLVTAGVDFHEIAMAENSIKNSHPYLFDYNNYLPQNIGRVEKLLTELPSTEEFLANKDKGTQIRIYLLGLLAMYQNILHEHSPKNILTPLQIDLLRQQILCSTRFSENLNNMMANFEIGGLMINNNHMETIILCFAHELAHRIYSINGFDAHHPAARPIHECSADIGAFSIAQHLGYKKGLPEYVKKIIVKDDFSKDNRTSSADLIAQGIPHRIGRTQLGHLTGGFQEKNIILDWETLFAVNLVTLCDQSEPEKLDHIQQLVSGYIFNTQQGNQHYPTFHHFMDACQKASSGTGHGTNSIIPQPVIADLIGTAQATIGCCPQLPTRIMLDL